MKRVPWERVKEWAEERKKLAHESLLKDLTPEETAQMRTVHRVYVDLLRLEREDDGV